MPYSILNSSVCLVCLQEIHVTAMSLYQLHSPRRPPLIGEEVEKRLLQMTFIDGGGQIHSGGVHI